MRGDELRPGLTGPVGVEAPSVYQYGGSKVPDELRRKFATVIRTLPDGTVKHMYPIWNRESAARAMENILSAQPPLTFAEMRLVIGRARHYLGYR